MVGHPSPWGGFAFGPPLWARPAAFLFWVSPLDAPLESLPETPLVGIRIHVPGLRFELPSILPDIDLDDLRALDLPLPLLQVGYIHQGRLPAWLGRDGAFALKDWRGLGPVPAAVRERFPNR